MGKPYRAIYLRGGKGSATDTSSLAQGTLLFGLTPCAQAPQQSSATYELKAEGIESNGKQSRETADISSAEALEDLHQNTAIHAGHPPPPDRISDARLAPLLTHQNT